jgi:hypothetical protein
MGFPWVDTNWRFFVSTVRSLLPAAPIERLRLRQVEKEADAEPERIFMTIKQPKASALYYTAAAKIDPRNRVCQADLGIERKLGTHDWSQRVNLSIFSMVAMDAMDAYLI